MRQWKNRLTRQRYFYHYLFWAIVLLSYIVDAAELRQFNPHLFLHTLVLKNGLLVGIVYLHLRVLIPAFLRPGRYGLYVLSLLLTISLGTYLIHAVEIHSWQGVYAEHHQEPLSESEGQLKRLEIEEKVVVMEEIGNRWLLDGLTVCRYIVISLLLKFIDDFFRQREQLQQMQVEKARAELSLLKAQVNPHFLFNTLNNLYGLALEKSELTAPSLLKLADIMRYTLSEQDGQSVPLATDLEHLQHYIDLECLRVPDRSRIRYRVEGEIAQQRIAPLLLLPLVENAFKHGVHRTRERYFLDLLLRIEGQTLHFSTYNSMPENREEAPSLGMGLENVRKRLELLYPDRYRLDTSMEANAFRLNLSLSLA